MKYDFQKSIVQTHVGDLALDPDSENYIKIFEWVSQVFQLMGDEDIVDVVHAGIFEDMRDAVLYRHLSFSVRGGVDFCDFCDYLLERVRDRYQKILEDKISLNTDDADMEPMIENEIADDLDQQMLIIRSAVSGLALCFEETPKLKWEDMKFAL